MDNSSSRATSAGYLGQAISIPAESASPTTTFDALPSEILLKIWETLALTDKARLTRISQYYHGLFQPELRAARLLLFVVRGEQVTADVMLKRAPELLLTACDVTDYSGRTFKKITAYEYAYWAKDTHMCRMLEAHMDYATKAKMLERCEAMERDGLTYEQHGVVVKNSKHFDFTPLITALTRYVRLFDNWYASPSSIWEVVRAAWMEVGLAQRGLPVYVVNEYCRPGRSFFPLPAFKEETLPRNLTCYSHITKSTSALFPLVVSEGAGLGVDSALIRWGGERGALRPAGGGAAVGRWASIDLAAVSYLDSVRTANLTQSRENLQPRGHNALTGDSVGSFGAQG